MRDTFTFTCGTAIKTLTLENEESIVMKEAAMMLLEADIPGYLEIESNCSGSAYFTIRQRGKYKKNGVEMPSMYVTCTQYFLDLRSSKYADAYLTCVNPESNNYKFYWLRPNNSGPYTVTVAATYGRIGSDRGEAFGTKDLQTPYEPYLYWIRYYEKLSKGYIDQTNIYLNSEPVKPKREKVEEEEDESDDSAPAKELYDVLFRYAKGVVEETLQNTTVTQAQCDEGWKVWNDLSKAVSVEDFNQRITKLIALSPRKCRHVTDLLANSDRDFAEIISREESLLNAMSAVARTEKPAKKRKSGPCFKDFGIDVHYATEDQETKVKEKLPVELRQKVLHIYRVVPEKQKERFNSYLKRKGITVVKELWHGSRNENWLSIIKNGLLLNPNAISTGKMLGYASYCAPSPTKSWGYTSAYGTYWAHGNSNRAFMGLFATAYGNPLFPTRARQYTQAELDREHKDCVHAKAGTTINGFSSLRNDEVAFYNEDATLLNYIVEFAA